MSSNATLDVSGSLLGNTTNAGGFNISGTVVLDGRVRAARRSSWRPCRRIWETPRRGSVDNFAYNTLELTANTYVELVDNAANSPATRPRPSMSTP